MKMKKCIGREGYEFSMSKKSSLIFMQELSKAINHCEDDDYSGTFTMRCNLVDGKGKKNNVIHLFKVLPDNKEI